MHINAKINHSVWIDTRDWENVLLKRLELSATSPREVGKSFPLRLFYFFTPLSMLLCTSLSPLALLFRSQPLDHKEGGVPLLSLCVSLTRTGTVQTDTLKELMVPNDVHPPADPLSGVLSPFSLVVISLSLSLSLSLSVCLFRMHACVCIRAYLCVSYIVFSLLFTV